MTLTRQGCVRLYEAANQRLAPDPWRGLAGCRACPIGARHATGHEQNPITVLADALRMLCPRCGRLASRMIWGALCASCDARQREAVARRNAKGSVPALSARLHTERVAVSTSAITIHVVHNRGVASLPEAILYMSKSATGPTSYGRRRVQWPGFLQLEMGL